MKPEVYFSKLKKGQNRLDCFKSLLGKVGTYIHNFKQDSFVGIKMTIGDKKNKGHIKPEFVRVLVENLKKHGTKPFVFDTNVIYKGERQNAVDHLNLAHNKGFTIDNLGCPFIVAGGIFGADSKIIKMDFKNIKEIKFINIL